MDDINLSEDMIIQILECCTNFDIGCDECPLDCNSIPADETSFITLPKEVAKDILTILKKYKESHEKLKEAFLKALKETYGRGAKTE